MPDASPTTKGETKISVAAVSATNPIAVGDNDPRVNKLNAALYANFSDAVDAAAALSGTNILKVTTNIAVSSSKTVPSNVILEFDNGGQLSISAGTVTIEGELRAPAQRIFSLSGSGAVDISAAEAEAFYFEWYGITSGADNTTALQNLISARKGVQFGETTIRLLPGVVYSFASPISFDDTFGMGLVGGRSAFWGNQAELRYTGSGSTPAITVKSAQGFSVEGVKFSYTSTTFTGFLVLTGHSSAGRDSTGLTFTRCFFQGVGSASASSALLSLDKAIIVAVRDCQFLSGLVGITALEPGGTMRYSNVVMVENCTFNNCGIAIKQSGQSWTIQNCTFEPVDVDMAGGIKAGEVRALISIDTSWNLVFQGNWLGDATATSNSYFAIDLCYAYGAVISGNFAYLTPSTGAGGQVTILGINACHGVSVTGNMFSYADRFMAFHTVNSTGTVFSGNHRGCANNEINYDSGFYCLPIYDFDSSDGKVLYGSLRAAGAIIGGSTIGLGVSDIIVGPIAGRVPEKENGSGIRVTENVSGYPDGSLIIQPRTKSGQTPGKVSFLTTSVDDAFVISDSSVKTKLPLGYATGAGGSVTQNTSKSTSVTLNKSCGQITMNPAALAANTVVSFTLSNSVIEATDVVSIHRASGGTSGSYQVWVDSVSTGSCVIYVRNISAGSLSESPVINFSVIKAVNS